MNNIVIEPFFSTSLLMGLGTGVAGVVVWHLLCRYVRSDAEQHYKAAMKLPASFDQLPIQERIAILNAQRKLAGQGSPRDRLFIFGLTAAFVSALGYFSMWSLGITPAGAKEREVIDLIRSSELAARPTLLAALRVVDESLYTSRSDYLLLTAAYSRVSGVFQAAE